MPAPGAGRIIAEPHSLKKALRFFILGAFFVCATHAHATSECRQLALAGGRPVDVKKVFDGDTVRLDSGEKLRFAGINTPETRRADRPAQPFADRAKRRVETLVQEHAPWVWVAGARKRDHYGRLLGHLVSADGLILERQLLREGLAFLVVKPPAVAHAICFEAAESHARERVLGVWSSPYWQYQGARDLTSADAGYRRIQGVVTKVDQAGDMFVELDDRLVIRVRAKHRQYFPEFDSPQRWSNLLGRTVQVNGWLTERKLSAQQIALGRKAFFMDVGTHFGFRVADVGP